MESTSTYVSDIAFSPAVKALQARKGSRRGYARMERGGSWQERIAPDLKGFIEAQTSIFLATASAAGEGDTDARPVQPASSSGAAEGAADPQQQQQQAGEAQQQAGEQQQQQGEGEAAVVVFEVLVRLTPGEQHTSPAAPPPPEEEQEDSGACLSRDQLELLGERMCVCGAGGGCSDGPLFRGGRWAPARLTLPRAVRCHALCAIANPSPTPPPPPTTHTHRPASRERGGAVAAAGRAAAGGDTRN